jgi:hypothetical protein
MADDKTKHPPGNAQRINLDDEYQVAYWTGKFRVTKLRLAAAVRAVGHSVEAVKKYLKL